MDLPVSPIRACGPRLVVMVEPAPTMYGSIVLPDTSQDRDDNDAPGYGWILSMGREAKKKLKGMGVEVGSKILFRRFLRSEGLMQFDFLMNNVMKVAFTNFPNHDWFFLHYEDALGVVDE